MWRALIRKCRDLGPRLCRGDRPTATVPDGLHMSSGSAPSVAVGASREIQIPVRINHKVAYASDYDRWIADFENSQRGSDSIEAPSVHGESSGEHPGPGCTAPRWIFCGHTIESVRKQSYSNWNSVSRRTVRNRRKSRASWPDTFPGTAASA